MNIIKLDKFRFVSGFGLKWIAVVSMIIDHIGSILMDGVVEPYMVNGSIIITAQMPFMVKYTFLIKEICEVLGSIAFPIFCFLIAEGFIHTRNRLKYGLLMLCFALISEIPYDLAHYHVLTDFSLQNVMFTLSVGIFTLYFYEMALHSDKLSKKSRIALAVLIIAMGSGLAFLIKGEYVFLGVLTIAAFYILKDKPYRAAGIVFLLPVSPWVLLSLIPILLYSGKRGKGSKYFFYIFYPSHFLILYGGYLLLLNR